jgi:hypothetical protein
VLDLAAPDSSSAVQEILDALDFMRFRLCQVHEDDFTGSESIDDLSQASDSPRPKRRHRQALVRTSRRLSCPVGDSLRNCALRCELPRVTRIRYNV